MPWNDALCTWLTYSALVTLAFTVLGGSAAAVCRQPVRRLKIIELTLLGCLIAPWLHLIPGYPQLGVERWGNAIFPHRASSTPSLPLATKPVFAPEMLPNDSAPMLANEVRLEPSHSTAHSTAQLTYPAVETTQTSACELDLGWWIGGIYLLCVAGGVAWWLAGVVVLARIICRAEPAPPRCRELLANMAGDRAKRVRLLTSRQAKQPFVTIWDRAVIVLPAGLCHDEQSLRWALAHEWTHIERGDFRVWLVAGLARVMYFYNPLVWWLRRQLRLCQDYVADAQASRQAAAPEDYAEFLVARAAAGSLHPAMAGLGMGFRKSELYRRIVMLVQKHPIESRVPRRWTASVTLAAFVLTATLPALSLPRVMAAEPIPSIEEIISILEEQREQVKSVEVETKQYSTFVVDPKILRSWPSFKNTANVDWQEESHFAYKGGMRYHHWIQSHAPREEGSSNDTTKGQDTAVGRHVNDSNDEQVDGRGGGKCWERRVNLNLGPAQIWVRDYDPKQQWVHNPEYFREIGWDCNTEANTQDESELKYYHTYDFLQLLKRGAYTIAAELEDVDGFKCVVLKRQCQLEFTTEDRAKPDIVKTSETIWLDQDHGMAIRKHDELYHDSKYRSHRSIHSDFVEVRPGIWFPKKIETPRFASPKDPQGYQGKLVATEHIDVAKLTANEVSDDLFKVHTEPSDILIDTNTGKERVIEAPSEAPATEMWFERPASSGNAEPSSKSVAKPLSAEAARLINAMAAAGSARAKGAPPHAAVFSAKEGDPAEGIVKLLKSRSHCSCGVVTADDIRSKTLAGYDVVLFPGGQGSKQAQELGEQGRQAVREFVRNGGGYVGICAGAVLACSTCDWTLGVVNAKTMTGRKDALGPDGIMSVDMGLRGSGIQKMELTDAGLQLFGGPSGIVQTLFAVGPVFLPAERNDLPDYVCLAQYRSEIWRHQLQKGTMVDSPAILAGKFGNGAVILFSPHPEASNAGVTPGLDLLIVRAVLATARKPAN